LNTHYLKGLYKRTSSAYISLGTNAEIVETNEHWCRVSGYSIDEMLGRPFSSFLADTSLNDFCANFNKLIDKGLVSNIIYDIRLKDGSVLNVTLDGKVLYDEEGLFVQTFCVLKPSAESLCMDNVYQNILSATTVPFLVYDPETERVADVNEACCNFYGYSYKQLMQKKITDLNAESRTKVRQYIDRIAMGDSGIYPVTHRLADGSLRQMESHPNVITFDGKKYIFAMMIDVTDKLANEKRLNAMLELSKKMLKADITIVEITDIVLAHAKLLTKAEDGYVATIDENSKELVIHTLTKMMDKCRMQDKKVVFTQDDQGRYPALFGDSLNTKTAYYVNTPSCHPSSRGVPEGHVPIDNALFVPVMHSGKLIGQIALANKTGGFTDADLQAVQEISTIYALAVISFKHTEEIENFREIFKYAQEGIIVAYPVENSRDIRVLNMNSTARNLLGVNDCTGMHVPDLFTDISIMEFYAAIHRVSRTGTAERVNIEKYITKSGSFMADCYIFMLPNRYIICILRDLTSLHKAQSELKELNDQLISKVEQELTVRRKQEQIIHEQKKLADLGQMLNAIAHQWRQPINALGLYAQDVVDAYEMGELNSEYLENFQKVNMELIMYLSDTIDDFRTFFKPDKNRTEFEAIFEIIDILRLLHIQFSVRNIALEISCTCKHKNFKCTNAVDYPECGYNKTRLYGFLGEFKQAMINLLYNAADAIDERFQKGDNSKGIIYIDLYGGDSELEIVVRDNGTGIPSEILPNIFDPYFTTKTEGKGTGIGLYMTKLVVENHMGGKLSAGNWQGGAILSAVFPVYASDSV
jgi:PAS domain S-box-containing protein